MRYNSARSAAFIVIAGALGVTPWLRAQPPAVNALSQHYDRTRVGATLVETVLNTSNVSSAKFGKLWTLYADGQVVAQPLYVSALAIDTTGNTNTPLVRARSTPCRRDDAQHRVRLRRRQRERGADGRTIPLWATWLGPPRPGGKDIDMWSTNDPEWGILGTPVVSDDKKHPLRGRLARRRAARLRYRLHALDLQNGHAPPTAGVDRRAVRPILEALQAAERLQSLRAQTARRAAADQGVVYVAFGGDGNRGALFAFDAQTLAQRAFWSSTPTGETAASGSPGQGPAADAEGNVYLMTGNGTFDAEHGRAELRQQLRQAEARGSERSS